MQKSINNPIIKDSVGAKMLTSAEATDNVPKTMPMNARTSSKELIPSNPKKMAARPKTHPIIGIKPINPSKTDMIE